MKPGHQQHPRPVAACTAMEPHRRSYLPVPHNTGVATPQLYDLARPPSAPPPHGSTAPPPEASVGGMAPHAPAHPSCARTCARSPEAAGRSKERKREDEWRRHRMGCVRAANRVATPCVPCRHRIRPARLGALPARAGSTHHRAACRTASPHCRPAAAAAPHGPSAALRVPPHCRLHAGAHHCRRVSSTPVVTHTRRSRRRSVVALWGNPAPDLAHQMAQRGAAPKP